MLLRTSTSWVQVQRGRLLNPTGVYTSPLLCLQRQNMDYHALYTTFTFQAGTTAAFN